VKCNSGGLRGVRGVEDNKDQPNFILTLENTANQLQGTHIIKVHEMHNFSDLFDKILYMFQTGPLSIIRSISTLYTRNWYLSY
jgi:hypothetical protein